VTAKSKEPIRKTQNKKTGTMTANQEEMMTMTRMMATRMTETRLILVTDAEAHNLLMAVSLILYVDEDGGIWTDLGLIICDFN